MQNKKFYNASEYTSSAMNYAEISRGDYMYRKLYKNVNIFNQHKNGRRAVVEESTEH